MSKQEKLIDYMDSADNTGYVGLFEEDNEACLDGRFNPEDLRKIADIMESKDEPNNDN